MNFENVKNTIKNKWHSIFGVAIIFLLYVTTSFLAQKYEAQIIDFVGPSAFSSMFLYVLITILAIVVAPFSTLPLIPIATTLWGWFMAGILSIIGWVIGSQIAFYITRKVKGPLLHKFVSLQKIADFENKFPEKKIFWTLVFLRMITPVDILSYATGFLTKIKGKTFLLATIIGVTPFAFVFAYTGTLTLRYQAIVAIEILTAIILLSYYSKNLKKSLLVIFVLTISTLALLNKTEILSLLQNLENLSVNNPFATSAILIGLKTISAPLGFPGTPLTLLSGSLLGSLWGTIVALIGNTLGASLAFLLSRYVLKDYVQNKFLQKYPRIKKYEEKLEKNSFRTVVVLRLIPLFPFNALNFLLGTLNISFKKYVVGSFVGMIPGTALFVYFGGSLRALSPVNILLATLGIIALIYFGKKYEKNSLK